MASSSYRYSAEPTRNPLRYARAVWRLLVRDPETTTDEAALVEMGLARSKLGRRFARWDDVVRHLRDDPRTARALDARSAFGPIRLDAFASFPAGSVGRIFADHCRARDIDPNLVQVPPDDEVGWLLNHLYQTHDLWHLVTGWGNDLPGEVGLGGFYAAQLGNPPFFGTMLALILLNVVRRRAALGPVLAAFGAGYRAGQRSEPLFGADWEMLLGRTLEEVRAHFAIDRSEIVGEGIRVAA